MEEGAETRLPGRTRIATAGQRTGGGPPAAPTPGEDPTGASVFGAAHTP